MLKSVIPGELHSRSVRGKWKKEESRGGIRGRGVSEKKNSREGVKRKRGRIRKERNQIRRKIIFLILKEGTASYIISDMLFLYDSRIYNDVEFPLVKNHNIFLNYLILSYVVSSSWVY